MRKTNLTLEQHLVLSEHVRQLRDAMMQVHVMNVGTKASKENRAVHSVLDRLDHLKSVFDNVVFRDFPKLKDATMVYYNSARSPEARMRAWHDKNGPLPQLTPAAP